MTLAPAPAAAAVGPTLPGVLRSGTGPGPRSARLRRPALALLAGALLAVAFPPVGIWVTAPLGVGLLPLAVRGTGGRAAAGLGFLTGLAFFVPVLAFTRIAGADAWIALAVIEAALLAPAGAAFAAVQRLRGGPLWCAAVWVGAEALRARVPFGGFPWARVAFSQVDGPLAPLAALGGAPLVSAAAALSGAGLLTALVQRRPRWLAAAVLPAVLALAVPLPTVGQVAGASPATVTVAVVQGNVPRLGLDFNSQRAAVLTNHVQATLGLAADVRAGRVAAPDVVVWPENSSDLDPFTQPDAMTSILGAVRAIDRPVLVGAVLDGPGPAYVSNAGLVFTPAGDTGQRYVKRHPVPFGEYVPFRAELTRVVGRLADKIPRDFVHGRGSGAIDLGPVRVGDVICFEVAYDDLVRSGVRAGARLLAVQTNNATFGRTSEAAQQLQMTRLRAVEHGRAAVVASTSGISAVVRPDGAVVRQTGIFTRGVLVERVPLRSSTTLADRAGAWPEAALAALALLGWALGVLVGRRRRRVPGERGGG